MPNNRYNTIAQEIQNILDVENDIPIGLIIKAINELDKQQKKLESAIVPWAGFTDKLKKIKD